MILHSIKQQGTAKITGYSFEPDCYKHEEGQPTSLPSFYIRSILRLMIQTSFLQFLHYQLYIFPFVN